MKKIYSSVLLILIFNYTKSQIAVGKQITTNNSVSLEFSSSENKGLILPYTEDKTAIATNGTLIYDISDHKVKYLKDTGLWFDLSVDNTGTADISIQTNKNELSTTKAVIGSNGSTDTTPGALILSDNNKAMILPQVASPHLNIINPAPGMIVYDTIKRQLAVYNGTVWSFWKP